MWKDVHGMILKGMQARCEIATLTGPIRITHVYVHRKLLEDTEESVGMVGT